MLAGIGIGAMTTADIRSAVKIRYVVDPDPERHEKYQPLKTYFAELYKRNMDIMHAL